VLKLRRWCVIKVVEGEPPETIRLAATTPNPMIKPSEPSATGNLMQSKLYNVGTSMPPIAASERWTWVLHHREIVEEPRKGWKREQTVRAHLVPYMRPCCDKTASTELGLRSQRRTGRLVTNESGSSRDGINSHSDSSPPASTYPEHSLQFCSRLSRCTHHAYYPHRLCRLTAACVARN
jgi:hypothetical protein